MSLRLTALNEVLELGVIELGRGLRDQLAAHARQVVVDLPVLDDGQLLAHLRRGLAPELHVVLGLVLVLRRLDRRLSGERRGQNQGGSGGECGFHRMVSSLSDGVARRCPASQVDDLVADRSRAHPALQSDAACYLIGIHVHIGHVDRRVMQKCGLHRAGAEHARRRRESVGPGGSRHRGALGGGVPRRLGRVLRRWANLLAQLLSGLADLLARLLGRVADLLARLLGGFAGLLGRALRLLLVLLVAGRRAERADGEHAREADVRERAQAGRKRSVACHDSSVRSRDGKNGCPRG